MSVPLRPIAIAPATDGDGSSRAVSTQRLMSQSCLTCARRKVKCDKMFPMCSACRKNKGECEYDSSTPRKRKRKQAEQGLLEKLERYERLLQHHGLILQPEQPHSNASDFTPRTASNYPTPATEATSESKSGKLIAGNGKTRFIDNNLWRTLGEEALNPSSDEDDHDDENYPQQTKLDHRGSQLDPVTANIMGSISAPALNLLDYHPKYDAALKLWKVYVDYVEPLVKVIHVPTTMQMVQRGAANPSKTSKATECLLFAIYHFAVYALTDEECMRLFSQQRAVLLSKYYDALRQALVKVSFLRSSDITVLQAYMLFLMSVRNSYEHNVFWILTGVACRIAQRLGLHRDSAELGLPPFEGQIRSRVFWALLPLDGIASQLCGTGISIGYDSYDTKTPLNINDVDIWPGMTDKPQERQGATDMMFCLARSEVGRFHREAKVRFATWASCANATIPNERELEESFEAIDALESKLESKYLRYCDFTVPLHCAVMALGRGSCCAARFRTYLHRDKTYTKSERETISALAMKILEYNHAAQTTQLTRRFKWHLRAVFQWDPVVWVLNELRRSEPCIDAGTVWSTMELIFQIHPDFLTKKRALHLAVGRMMLRAWESTMGSDCPDTPFITSIRALATNNRSSKSAQLSPTNVFMSVGNTADLPLPGISAIGNPGITPFDYNLLDNMSPDGIDWTFWDQLAQEQDVFSIEDSGKLPFG
ncbi:Hypothetical protein R9X50_00608300 [Acrodontium crateriforme]|uniref:Zn(2)-C6 fungal-type domain-containing protein n=1 Tax=Acrodontium crateriforme TaxID=150365 RepID=A0AAQ3MAY3_9PEZI|nr:Hypothetical protein R9X50_00608300 [Acrodontium crateriforme]